MLKINLQIKYLLLVLLLVVPAFISLTKSGYFPMHDDIQPIRVLQMHKCILDFQIPCRWSPDMGYGYGYPQFNYYAPLPYYFMELAVIAGTGILASVKFGFAVSIIASAVSMYFLGSKLWGKTGGVIAALFYTYAPYRAVDIYVRGAMGEAWAFVFLPLILLYTFNVLEGKKKSILPLSLSLAGLALSHNITVLMFIPFYALFVLLIKRLNVKSIKNLFISGIWGVSLSAFFTFPAFLEKNYVHVDTILQGYFNYLAHYVGLKQLLFSTFWGYGSSAGGDLDGMSLTVGLFHWTIALITIAILLYLKKVATAKRVLLFTSLSLVSIFLIHPRSQFIWDALPLMAYIQFPWRFLTIAVLFFSLSIGSLGKLIRSHRFYAILIAFVLLILFNASFFNPVRYLSISDSEKLSNEAWRLQQTISIFDYLPKGATAPPATRAPEAPYSETTEIEVIESQKGTNWQNWILELDENSTVIFPTFDFPNWEAIVDGVPAEVESYGDLGLIAVDLPKGEHKVELKLKDTPLRSVSNLVSLLALIAIPIYLKKNEKH